MFSPRPGCGPGAPQAGAVQRHVRHETRRGAESGRIPGGTQVALRFFPDIPRRFSPRHLLYSRTAEFVAVHAPIVPGRGFAGLGGATTGGGADSWAVSHSGISGRSAAV